MGESPGMQGGSAAGIDLSQFYQVFFEEAGENLQQMEQLLLALDVAAPDDEQLNAIFRCAHSIKGGAATFGFSDVAELTHVMETLLDKLRRHELAATAGMVDVLLASGDALAGQLARHQAGGAGHSPDTAALRRQIAAYSQGESPAPQALAPAPAAQASAPGTVPAAAQPSAAPPQAEAGVHGAEAADVPVTVKGERILEMTLGPLERPGLADDVLSLFKEIEGLGQVEPVDGGLAADGLRRFKLITATADSELLDLFAFHIAREQVRLRPWAGEHIAPGYGFYAKAPGSPVQEEDPGYGFFDDAPGAPGSAAAAPEDGPARPAEAVAAAPAAAPSARAEAKPAGLEGTTLRVGLEKVDQLINLMGELVITQAMLAQHSRVLDPVQHQTLIAGLTALDRNTRDLQEAVMSIRMIPMGTVFSRFPRMLRDLAAKLGKEVELLTVGEATELDKGLVEKITDPLTHLVRNACDHGIELPEERRAKGKPEQGTITLAASHQGGSIVIEVRDDGKGLSRAKLLKKARERGLAVSEEMSDAEVWSLIFAPGFSTAEVVTDVSGRGVGMDVVKKNISALGGTVEIDSAEGHGMRVAVRLPLTLAIMDGMSVGVAEEVYILPLASVVESFQVTPQTVKTLGGTGRVVQVREEYMPVIELESLFHVPREDGQQPSHPIMVVVEAEGSRVAMMVDELLGQQQVVVKNLEANYRKVPDISGATIMGDGRVALILDVASLVRRSRH
ncbi:chemotaxis protein CheW [Piscinibacter sp. Jin2]|uniref:Chemotaxis protein CheA n=1 Tax=Aquariibacter lacus TaxID=2801332 RepID=A0A9X0XGF5_9BURK|nr:chemotaxis protein CheW [Piscinibacter lacus]MBL0720457.1 chemotaxis protein CheW [Piscinibacter lacus]